MEAGRQSILYELGYKLGSWEAQAGIKISSYSVNKNSLCQAG